ARRRPGGRAGVTPAGLPDPLAGGLNARLVC
ncbi:MAG: hypothetical protein K0R01_2355, partial [Mycobacterium sp.]|nr:hypothetical protein [Mycobacterium sp.]